MITLYGTHSPNILKIVLMLEELGLPYELRFVSLFKGEQFSPEFLAINPAAKVPVLVDPALGRPVAESGAILIWLAEHYGAYLPKDAPARMEVFEWLMRQMASIGPMFGQLTHFRLLPEGSEPYATGRYRAQAEKLYRLLDERMAGREWLAGGEYSIADFATVPWAQYLERHGFEPADYPNMVAWRDKIARRPAAQRAQTRMVEAFAPGSKILKTATPTDLDRFFGRTESMPVTDYSAVTRL